MPTAWEYRLELVELDLTYNVAELKGQIGQLEQRLNALGAEGWELVSDAEIPLISRMTLKKKDQAHLFIFRRSDERRRSGS